MAKKNSAGSSARGRSKNPKTSQGDLFNEPKVRKPRTPRAKAVRGSNLPAVRGSNLPAVRRLGDPLRYDRAGNLIVEATSGRVPGGQLVRTGSNAVRNASRWGRALRWGGKLLKGAGALGTALWLGDMIYGAMKPAETTGTPMRPRPVDPITGMPIAPAESTGRRSPNQEVRPQAPSRQALPSTTPYWNHPVPGNGQGPAHIVRPLPSQIGVPSNAPVQAVTSTAQTPRAHGGSPKKSTPRKATPRASSPTVTAQEAALALNNPEVMNIINQIRANNQIGLPSPIDRLQQAIDEKRLIDQLDTHEAIRELERRRPVIHPDYNGMLNAEEELFALGYNPYMFM